MLHPIVGIGVPDDPCSTHRRFCNSRANSHRTHVGGDDPGAPLSDACRNPARCGHRALQGAVHPNQSVIMKNVRRIHLTFLLCFVSP